MKLGVRLAALSAGFALLALGGSAGRQPEASPAALGLQGGAALERAGIDIGAVIETVGHRIEPAKGNPGAFVSGDRLYRAEFSASGFSLTLRRKLSPGELAARKSARRDTLPDGRHGAMPAQAIPFEDMPAFTIEAALVRRGGRPLALARDSWRSDRNRAVRRVAPALSERVTAREGRLDWDYLLDRAPPGKGALTIEARVSAAGTGERGPGSRPAWRFPTRAGRSVTVGVLVVRDARGRALYRALPGLAGRRLSLTVPERILRGAAYPLTIDPVVSPEYPASDPVQIGAPGDQGDPALAFDGTNYLTVWSDARGTIYGARFSPAGAVLDVGGIPISTGSTSGDADVAFDGSTYFVAWEDYRGGIYPDIYGARVSTAGNVLDPAGIVIASAQFGQYSPAVSFDGTNFFVAWNDHRSGDDLYGARVSPDGTVLDPSGIPISTAANGQREPAVAFDGTNYLVAWEDCRAGGSGCVSPDFRPDIYGARVSPAGTVLDSAGIAISTATNQQLSPAIAFDGTNYFIAWSDYRSIPEHIYGARVSPAGTVLDPSGIGISTTAPQGQVLPAVAFDGRNYLVCWQDNRLLATWGIYGARVSRAGTVLDPAGIAIATVSRQLGPAVAFDGTNYLVAWTRDVLDGNADVCASRVSPDSEVRDPAGILISNATNNQYAPAIAFDGTNYLVVWQDFRLQTTNEIYGARVSQSGALLDGGGIAISTAADEQQAPAVAFDGTNYLVVWQDYRSGIAGSRYDIYGARVSPAGAVLDPGGIAISTAQRWQWAPSLAFDGTNYLVAWMDYRSTTSWDVYGARVSPNGGVLDPSGIAISTAADSQQFPALAFDGANYLVAWHDYRSPLTDVYGARVSPAGGVLDPAGIPISTAPSYQLYPSLAFDGTNYLVAWMDYRGGGYDIYGSRVSPAGTVLDPAGIAISSAPNNQFFPALAFDGTNYLAAWQDYRSGTSWDIDAVRVSPSGAVFDPTAVATAATNELAPSLARGPAGRVAVAYERYAPEAPYGGAQRVFLRFVDY